MSFSELYLIYYPKLVRFAKEFVMSEEDAENITQDVFTDLWEKKPSHSRHTFARILYALNNPNICFSQVCKDKHSYSQYDSLTLSFPISL